MSLSFQSSLAGETDSSAVWRTDICVTCSEPLGWSWGVKLCQNKTQLGWNFGPWNVTWCWLIVCESATKYNLFDWKRRYLCQFSNDEKRGTQSKIHESADWILKFSSLERKLFYSSYYKGEILASSTLSSTTYLGIQNNIARSCEHSYWKIRKNF